MAQISINGKEVTTFQELKGLLHPDGQSSGTLVGNVNIDGEDFFIRKHWSYSGGFPVYDGDNQVGEIVLAGGKSYCEGKYQELYDEKGKIKSDAKLSYIKRKN